MRSRPIRQAALFLAAAVLSATGHGSGGCARSDRDRYYAGRGQLLQPSLGDRSALVEPSEDRGRAIAARDPRSP